MENKKNRSKNVLPSQQKITKKITRVLQKSFRTIKNEKRNYVTIRNKNMWDADRERKKNMWKLTTIKKIDESFN